MIRAVLPFENGFDEKMKLPWLPRPLDRFFWTLYSCGEKSSGIFYIKHHCGHAVAIGFASRMLAMQFMRACNMAEPVAVRLSKLGSPAYPNPASWIPAAHQILIFWSEKELKDYFEDRQAFVDRATLTRYHVRYAPGAEG